MKEGLLMKHRVTISGILLAILPLLLAPVTAQAQDCSDCLVGVTELTLFYIGTSAYVEVYKGGTQKPDTLMYEGWHEWGDTLTFQGIKADGTMGSDISLWEDDVLNTLIHTSCSQPIGPGLAAGDFEVVEGYSRDGGLLCPLPCSDLDEDGYGTPANPACDYPERDCNDSDPGINPGATEVCDGIDNNCVDGIDEDPIASDSCDNGLYCDREEYCDAGLCYAGTLVDCGDGVGCTLDSCNEATDSCHNIPDDGLCDDAQWCNGAETCNATLGCQEGPDPCPDDGLWCNGIEGCNEGNDQCTNTGDPCEDGNNCTDSICIEQTHTCENTCNATGPEDACCDDPICWDQVICHDYDGDGLYAGLDCDDDDSDDPPVCGICACGDAECAPCARCINN